MLGNKKSNAIKISLVISTILILTGCASPAINYSNKNASINISPNGVNVNTGINYNLNF